MSLEIGILTERMILGYGVDVVVHETATRLVHDGYGVKVIATRVGEMYLIDGADYSIVDLSRHITETDIYSLEYMHECINILAGLKVDVWMIHTPPFYYWLNYLRPPVVMVEHGTPPGKFFPKQQGEELDRYTRDRYETTYRSLRPGDGLIAISNYIASELPKDVAERTVVILNGGDHYPRAHPGHVERYREEMGISIGQKMILWVGRIQPKQDLQPYKGLKDFVQIAAQLKETHPDLVVVAAGRGEEGALEFLEEHNIVPKLDVPREEMPVLFAAADIYINTSKWEGFNLALVEAQFQGTPVIAYNLCAHPEVVRHGDSGILVSNRKDMMKNLSELLDDPGRLARLAEGARKFSSNFTWDENVARLGPVIQGCHAEALRNVDRPPTPARHKKDLEYYRLVARRIIQREGYGVLVKECLNSLLKRLGIRK